MARDYFDESKKKKKKQETPQKKIVKSPSVSKNTQRTQQAQNQKSYGGMRNVPTQRTSTQRSTPQRTSQRTTQRTSQTTQTSQRQQPRRNLQADRANNQSRNPRIQDTATTVSRTRTPATSREMQEQRRQERQDRLQAAQRQKMTGGVTKEQQETSRRAIRNTPTVAKESLRQVGTGHGKTLADVTEANKSAAIGSKIDIKSAEFQSDIEKRRKKSTEASSKAFDELSKIQERSEAKLQKITKDAKGLEKAYYGALESGVGMATDAALGDAWAVSMLSRTYGNTRGQAQKEGATEAEDRAYALTQGLKEVGTEYLFRGIGLPGKLSGRASLSPSEKLAKAATKNMKGKLADLTHAGIRLAGGTAEENAEEAIAWGLDPLIKEFTYGKNTRKRQAQEVLRQESDELRSQVQSEEQARAMAAYLGSDEFIERNKRTYMDSGIGEEEAEDLAYKMRDYLTASLSGDTERMEQLDDELTSKLAGKSKDAILKEYSFSELLDTFASTTLLTATTGLPGSVSSATKGTAIRERYGTEGIRALANTAVDFEDKEMSLKAQAMRDRMDSGKDITSTQAYDLVQGMQQQYAKDEKRQQAAFRVAENTIRDENYVAPFGIDRSGRLVRGEVTDKTYKSTAKEAKEIIENYIESADEGPASLTDPEIDRGSKAVAGFQTGIFTVDDANELNFRNTAAREAFEKVTGIDLNSYIVRGKNGEVDIPATNAATKNALFAMAADNLVASATAETANWMDVTKGQVVSQISQRMGAQGAIDLQYVLDDVDERDRAKYMMTANVASLMYQEGRNLGVEWDSVKADAKRIAPGISEEKLREMYEAGRFDRDRASDKARGKQIRLGESIKNAEASEPAPMGELIIDPDVREDDVKGSVIRTFSEIASNLGVNIRLVSSFKDKNGNDIKNQNGMYDSSTGTITINVNAAFEKNVGYIFMHECTHHLKVFAPEQYQELENLVREKWFKQDATQMQAMIANKIEVYYEAAKKANPNAENIKKLTEEQALEEIIADAAHEFLTDPNFASEVSEENPSLAKAVLDSIRNALRAIRKILSLELDDETHMNSLFSQLDILDEAERLWLGAYKQAVANKAAVGIRDLQNQIYEEGKQAASLSNSASAKYERGDKLTHKQFNSFYSAHKLNYGASQKADLEETIDSIKRDGFISNTALSNVVPASINDFTDAENPNYTQGLYGAREGDTVLLVPKPYLDAKNDTVKNGFVPRDYEIVTVERNYQPYYELYSKAYDDAQNPTENPDIRFSLSAPVERVKDLIAVHNLKADDIRNTFELGGFPMPSIAVTKDSMGHDEYGDITLMFHSDTIDPEFFRSNQVFGGDAWTPTFPSIAKKVSRQVADRVEQKLRDILGLGRNDYSLGDLRLPSLDDDNLANALRYNEPYDAFKNDEVFQIAYLKNAKNFDVAVPTKEGNIRGLNKQALELLDDRLPKLTHDDIYDTVEHTMEYEPAVREARKAYYEAKGGAKLKALSKMLDEKMGYSDVLTRLEATIKFREEGIPEVTDREALDKILKEHVDQEGFKAWTDNLFEGIIEKTGIRNNKDMFTPSGNRRSWEALHDPVTLENVVKVMRSELAAGGNGLFGSNPKGAAQKQYKSLDEIRDDEDRLQKLSEEEYKAQSEVAVGKMSEVCTSIAEHNPGRFSSSFGAALDVGSYVAEILNSTRNKATIKRKLTADYNLDVTDEQMNDLMDAIDAIANLPTGYFEAKPRRAVGFDEVKAAVIPASTDEDIRQGFSDRGIQMYEYDPDVEGDRTEKINQAASEKDLRFSISEDLDEPYMAAVESGNMEEAQRLVDTAALQMPNVAKTIKGRMEKPIPLYHGTRFFGFTEFKDSKYEVPFIYTSTDRTVSAHYAGDNHYASVRPIGKPYREGDGIEDVIENANSVYQTDYRLMTVEERKNRYNKYMSEAAEIADKLDELYVPFSNWVDESIANAIDLVKYPFWVARDSDEDYRYNFDEDNGYREESVNILEDAMDGFERNIERVRDFYHDNYKTFDEKEKALLSYLVGYDVGDAAIYLSSLLNITNEEPRLINSVGNVVDPNFLRDSVDQSKGIGAYELYGDLGERPFEFDAEGGQWWALKVPEVSNDYTSTDAVCKWAYEHGYTSVIMHNIYDYGDKADNYVFFNSSQLKSADTVTYAEDGSVIPLSERFDPENNDIRYSMSTVDSDGNVLTDGQMEYFKNSQARDEKGRLQVMYHGTENAGFTVFDSDYGNSSRFFFFADSNDRAKGYSGTHDRFNAASYDSVDEANEYIRSWGNDDQVVQDGDDFIILEDGDEILRNASLSDLMMEYDEYSGFGGNAANYEVYLNVENPLVIDANGSSWDEISYDGDIVTTNWLAEYAYDEGYDGLIVDNVLDYGLYSSARERVPQRDIVVFSSSQIKDIRNTDPTNNPDIRFSYTEDDAENDKDARDYEHAMDDSYEMLEYYERMLDNADAQVEFIDLSDEAFNMEYFMKMLKKYGKADKTARRTGKAPKIRLDNTEEAMNKFYDSLTEELGMVYDDDYLEEGRMRMAQSKRDFYSRVDAKWNDRWLSEGEVLKIESVKKDVRNLVMGIMNNSDTGRQYRQDLVNKTLIDIRTAYQLMKQERTDLASALLYHSALRMISDVKFMVDDTEYQNYKDLRRFLKNTRISFSERYWNDVDFKDYRKRNRGKIKIVKGNNDIDKGIYDELVKGWPEYFGEAAMADNGIYKMDVPGMMEQIDYVLNLEVQPFMEAYSSEDCADWAFDIADDLYNIMEGGERIVSTADFYKEKYDAQAKAMKTRHAEALLRIRKAKEEGIAAERAKFREYKEQQKENKYHSKYFDSIAKSHKTLRERLLTNTKDKHIPEIYKAQLAELLSAFDFQTLASKKVEKRRGVRGKKTIQMAALNATLKNIAARSELFYLNDTITDIMDELLGINQNGAYARSIDGLTLDELNSDELKKIDKLFKSLIHEFNHYESVRTGTKRQQAADIGTAQIDSCIDHADKLGGGKDWNNFLGAMDKILNLDEVTPAYLFRMIDPSNNGLGLMFKELRRSFGKYVRNQEQLNKWMEDIIGEYHNNGRLWNKYGSDKIDEWRSSRSAREFNLQNGLVTLTPAQMMSIYCLSNRQQARDHMTGAGIVVRPVTYMAKIETDLKRKANYALPVVLTEADINLIRSQLTPEQIKVADKLQKLMANQMAEWGNEASMAVIGIRLFEDKDYFPIKSDKAALEKDFSADQFAEAIRNFGFTKAVQPGARNAIAVDDIFSVVAEHCNQMNLYNAYSEAMNDFMKVYNFHAMREDGSDYSVEQAIAHAYSQKATTFIGTFMKDLNGNVSKDRVTGIESMMNDALGKAKKASVFANGRVALQQPTAIMRAFAVINPKYLKGVSVTNATMKEMFEHSPIALWKSWGYYDINMGKSIEDIMMNDGNWFEDKMTDIYGKLDNRTWAAIWSMCKAEIEDKHKDVEKGSDEYWELVSQRMDEVVDLTQVVDSPFHRSHAMRSKNTLVKMATSFMAEPTLTYNMVRDGYIRAREQWKLGHKGAAGRIMGKTLSVFTLSAFTTAAAAAIWDAVRGKGADDDDENAFMLWWNNCLENFKDNINLLNNIYYVKDIVSLFQGWDQKNLGLQGIKHLSDAYAQLTGTRTVYSKLSWWENALAGIGYMRGYPIKTLMNDGKAILDIFGLHPQILSDIGDRLDSVQDMLAGDASDSGATKISSRNKDNNVKSSGTMTDSNGTAVHLWTYDDAPFHVEDGSLADKFLNHFGVNLTAAEIDSIEKAEAERELNEKIEDIRSKVDEKGLTGLERDKKVWSYVTTYMKEQNGDKPMSEFIQEGDYSTIREIKSVYLKAGGDAEYFDQRVFDTSKTALKKTISSDNTDAQKEAQQQIKNYLLSNGMDESELSQIAYKSYTTRDLKVAIRINDADAAVAELRALIEAGLTREDFDRIWENRNRGLNLKTYDGKYKDRLKSTGTYNWPISGQITSGFGHRSSPGGIGSTNHQGLDIAGSMGDPVTASDGGTVVYAGWYGGAGKTVMIQHDDGTVTQYSHLSWWDAKVGDTVAQGQYIGKVGSTGNSTGPHLHFGVMKNGSYVDPMKYLENKKS